MKIPCQLLPGKYTKCPFLVLLRKFFWYLPILYTHFFIHTFSFTLPWHFKFPAYSPRIPNLFPKFFTTPMCFSHTHKKWNEKMITESNSPSNATLLTLGVKIVFPTNACESENIFFIFVHLLSSLFPSFLSWYFFSISLPLSWYFFLSYSFRCFIFFWFYHSIFTSLLFLLFFCENWVRKMKRKKKMKGEKFLRKRERERGILSKDQSTVRSTSFLWRRNFFLLFVSLSR